MNILCVLSALVVSSYSKYLNTNNRGTYKCFLVINHAFFDNHHEEWLSDFPVVNLSNPMTAKLEVAVAKISIKARRHQKLSFDAPISRSNSNKAY